MKLSIIIPSFNEAATLAQAIKRVKQVKLSNIIKEIIVVDDGSTDGTRKNLTKITGITKIILPKNQGKGAAIRHGLTKAAGDYVLIQDADLEYDPEDIPALLEPILTGKARVVYGGADFDRQSQGGLRFPLYWSSQKHALLAHGG